MFAIGGTSYVYLTYGMHFMLNIAAGRADHPAAVLIRALRPTLGEEHMRLARAGGNVEIAASLSDRDLCRGPARLAQALSINFTLNALDLTTERRLFVQVPARREKMSVATSARIGVQNSGAWANTPLRFFDATSRFVSGPKSPPVYPDAFGSPQSRASKVRRKVG